MPARDPWAPIQEVILDRDNPHQAIYWQRHDGPMVDVEIPAQGNLFDEEMMEALRRLSVPGARRAPRFPTSRWTRPQETEADMPNNTGLRLPDRNYALVVHPTDHNYSPYLLIGNQWYLIDGGAPQGRTTPRLQASNPNDVRYYLHETGDPSRFMLAFMGAHHDLPAEMRGPQ